MMFHTLDMRSLFREKKWLRFCLWSLLLLSFVTLTIVFNPSHNREWELGQETLPYIHISESDMVTIEGFRNFEWQDELIAIPRYETREFFLNDINSVDVLISHFDDFEGLAHIFVSFGLTSGEHVVISLETRREKGETFSPVLGILRQFEIIYVVGSEQDIVGVRTDERNERVYLYPTTASKEQALALFLLLAHDVNSVYEKPRMYNTLLHNCTNEITRRVEEMSEVNFPLTWKTILPGYFDEVLYEEGIVDTHGSFEEVKARHLIDNTRVSRFAPTYSADLRALVTP
jgi:hypothetical protein